MEYDVIWEKGPLGVSLIPEIGDNMPPVVGKDIDKGSVADKYHVKQGDLLIRINGRDTARRGFDQSVDLLQRVRKPATLTFRPLNTKEKSLRRNLEKKKLDRKKKRKTSSKSIEKNPSEKLSQLHSKTSNPNKNKYTVLWTEGSLGISLYPDDENNHIPCIKSITGKATYKDKKKYHCGDQLISINSKNVNGFRQAIADLKAIEKPITLVFKRMYREEEIVSQPSLSEHVKELEKDLQEDGNYTIIWKTGEPAIKLNQGKNNTTVISRLIDDSSIDVSNAKIGDILVGVNEISTAEKSYKETLRILKKSTKPATLEFKPVKKDENEVKNDDSDNEFGVTNTNPSILSSNSTSSSYDSYMGKRESFEIPIDIARKIVAYTTQTDLETGKFAGCLLLDIENHSKEGKLLKLKAKSYITSQANKLRHNSKYTTLTRLEREQKATDIFINEYEKQNQSRISADVPYSSGGEEENSTSKSKPLPVDTSEKLMKNNSTSRSTPTFDPYKGKKDKNMNDSVTEKPKQSKNYDNDDQNDHTYGNVSPVEQTASTRMYGDATPKTPSRFYFPVPSSAIFMKTNKDTKPTDNLNVKSERDAVADKEVKKGLFNRFNPWKKNVSSKSSPNEKKNEVMNLGNRNSDDEQGYQPHVIQEDGGTPKTPSDTIDEPPQSPDLNENKHQLKDFQSFQEPQMPMNHQNIKFNQAQSSPSTSDHSLRRDHDTLTDLRYIPDRTGNSMIDEIDEEENAISRSLLEKAAKCRRRAKEVARERQDVDEENDALIQQQKEIKLRMEEIQSNLDEMLGRNSVAVKKLQIEKKYQDEEAKTMKFIDETTTILNNISSTPTITRHLEAEESYKREEKPKRDEKNKLEEQPKKDENLNFSCADFGIDEEKKSNVNEEIEYTFPEGNLRSSTGIYLDDKKVSLGLIQDLAKANDLERALALKRRNLVMEANGGVLPPGPRSHRGFTEEIKEEKRKETHSINTSSKKQNIKPNSNKEKRVIALGILESEVEDPTLNQFAQRLSSPGRVSIYINNKKVDTNFIASEAKKMDAQREKALLRKKEFDEKLQQSVISSANINSVQLKPSQILYDGSSRAPIFRDGKSYRNPYLSSIDGEDEIPKMQEKSDFNGSEYMYSSEYLNSKQSKHGKSKEKKSKYDRNIMKK